MSDNYCPTCGLQKSYGRTLAYYPDGPDLNKNICPKCGQTLVSADAQIAALTERLRAVEAERDRWRDASFCADQREMTTRKCFPQGAELADLRAELQRKDAALRRLESASVAVDKAWHYEARQGDGIMEEHEPQELELQMALIDARAALQPKEPPCQTA